MKSGRGPLLPGGLALGLAVLLAGCTVGPNYQRPKLRMPTVYRGAAAHSATGAAASLGNKKWWQVFHDPVLQRLIRTALRQNFDARMAADRVLEAQAQLGVTRAAQYPQVSAGAELFGQRNPKVSKVFPAYSTRAGEIDVAAIWNLDFWGKFRRQDEAARDQLLATEWGRREVMASVVSGVAAGYFQLRESDQALAIAQSTLATRRASAHLTSILAANGSESDLDLQQALELVYSAAEAVRQIESQREQQENAIRVLVGEVPGPIARPKTWKPPALRATVPAGLPAELLERRPDIREAEAELMAATANIGVAKADFFPNIALTGTGGLETPALNRLIATPSLLGSAAASAVEAIFAGGARHAEMRLTRAEEQEMLVSYQQTISTALEQVSDALIAYHRNRQITRQQARLAHAAAEADRLSNVLYKHGGASFLQVLTSETNDFAAQLDLAQARLNERLALVQLYNALGGGWQR
ncbi:MAG: efflux transporter outer membrane subunit [Terriglobales bacterium]